jgi:hypothetical protein
VSNNFYELKREADQRLADFRKVELKLGFSFLDLAKQHRSKENRLKSLEHARAAVETIRRFQGRIADCVEAARNHNESSKLETLLDSKATYSPNGS